MLNDILMLQIIAFQQYPRVYAQTHVNDIDVYKGSQWAVLNASVVKCPLRTLVHMLIVYKGV